MERSTVEDQMPPKLVSLAANELTVPLNKLSTVVYALLDFQKMRKSGGFPLGQRGTESHC